MVCQGLGTSGSIMCDEGNTRLEIVGILLKSYAGLTSDVALVAAGKCGIQI